MTNTPKILRDMTDAEIGALVRAHGSGQLIEFYDPCPWAPSWCEMKVYNGFRTCTAYRIAPPKFLPLEVGKVYRTQVNDWTCKFIDGDLAYLISYAGATAAYAWYTATGKAAGLGGPEYNIIGLSDNQEAGQ